FMFYNISNGFARTSGGRYIVPIDWIVILYFLIGVFQVITFFANTLDFKWALFTESVEHTTSEQGFTAKDLPKAVVILAILFGVGTLVPLAETLHGNRYQNFDISKA